MARKRYKKVSYFKTFCLLLFLLIIGVGVFVVGGNHPEEAAAVKEFAKEQGSQLLDKGKEILENGVAQSK